MLASEIKHVRVVLISVSRHMGVGRLACGNRGLTLPS